MYIIWLLNFLVLSFVTNEHIAYIAMNEHLVTDNTPIHLDLNIGSFFWHKNSIVGIQKSRGKYYVFNERSTV